MGRRLVTLTDNCNLNYSFKEPIFTKTINVLLMKLRQTIIRTSITCLSGIMALAPFVGVSQAFAASLTNLSDTMSRVQVSTASSHTLKFTTPSGATTSGKTIVLTFPSTFNFTTKSIASVSFTHGPSTGLETIETVAAG